MRGDAFPGGIALIDQHHDRPGLYATELYSDPLDDPSRLRGVISSFDYYDGTYFAAIIVLSRDVLSEAEFESHLQNVRRPAFHTDLP